MKKNSKKIPNKIFWKNKKIFLTGHTSFKGTWLKLWLESLGSKITGYSLNYPSQPKSLYKLIYKEKIKKESILNFNNLKKKLINSKSNIVFHFAAQSILSDANNNPLKNYQTNIIGTASLLEACCEAKNVKLVVIITTDKVYEDDSRKKFYDENSTLGGSEPYSVSKACAELISKSYCYKFKKLNKRIITLRAGNVIGGGDWKKDRLIPDIFKSLISKKKIFIRNPNATRPWQHVLDCLNGYLIAAEYSYKSKFIYNKWNFAPPLKNQIKVIEFINKLTPHYKFIEKNLIIKKTKTFYETERLNLISNKARNELGWKSVLSQSELIHFIINWYINYQKKEDMRNFSIQQIKDFCKLAKRK